jgi:hypothetical protein
MSSFGIPVSFDIDDATEDLILGGIFGPAVARVASGEAIAQFSSPPFGSDASIAHVSAVGLGTEFSYGSGCPGNFGYTLTDAAIGLPSAGNAAYRLAAWNGRVGDNAAVLLGTGPELPPIDLSIIGMTPGCFLHVAGIIISIPAAVSDIGLPSSVARIPLPIPPGASGGVLFRQWVEVQQVPTNPLGVVISNARRMSVQ